MPFDEGLSTRTVVGTFLTPRGNPASGYVIFTPRVLVHSTVDDALVFPAPVKKNLNTEGSFSVDLLDTDNEDLSPSGWGYAIAYRINGVPHHDFFAMVPAGVDDLNIADLTPLAEEDIDDSLYVPHSVVYGNSGGTPTTMIVPINSVVGRLESGVVSIPITDLDAPEMMRYFEAWDADTAYPSYSVVSHEDSLWLWAVEDDTELGDEPGVNASWLSMAGNTVHSVNGQIGTVVLDHDDVGAAAADHTHPNTDITGLGTAALVDTGTGATNAILGNDARLTDTRTPTTHVHSQSDITGLTTALGNKADLVGGVVPTSQIPSLAINDTFVVASEVAMLALTAEIGDVAIRTDLNRNFVLQVAGASTLGHWVQLSGGSDVVSVNSQTGNVVLGYSDVGAAPTSHTHAHTDITGLGTAAVADTGTGSSNVILGNDARLTDTRTPSASSIVDAMIATTLSPSKITGTAAILGANTFTAAQTIQGGLTLGAGAAVSTTTILSIGGGSNTSKGAYLKFLTDGADTDYIGHDRAINGGTSNDLLLYAGTALKVQKGSVTLARFYTNNTFTPYSASGIPVIAKGYAAQTANLFEAQTSAAAVVASISAAGHGTFSAGLRIPGNQSIYFGAIGSSEERLFATETQWGYSAGYRAIMLGSSSTASSGTLAGTTVFFGYNPSINASGSFSGNGGEVVFRNGMYFMVPNATDDGWMKVQQLNVDNVNTRVQHFIDGTADQIQSRVQGHSSQTANLQTWENSSASVLASISAAGAGAFNGVTVAAGYDINAAHAATGTTRYGVNAVNSVATGTGNSAFGYQAATSLTTGFSNVAMGYRALYVNTTGNYNTAIGHSTLLALASGDGNTALGWNALAAANGTTKNTAVGMWAQKVLASGNYNTTVGAESQYALNGGANNTSLGYGSLQAVTTGSGNIAIGYLAGAYSTNQSYELFINSIDRTNRAGDIAGSIIYGVQNATAASQTLTLNAAVTAVYGLTSNAATSIVGVADVSQLTVKGASGQSNSIQEWQNNSGTVLTRVGSSGFIGTQGGFGHNTAGQPYILPASGSLTALSQNAAHVAWTVKGAASQTANLQEWQNSSGTALANIYSDGSFLTPKIYVGSAGVGNSGSFGYASYEPLTGGSRINTSTQTNVALTVRNSHASASGKLQSWQVTTSDTEVASISAAGAIKGASIGPVSASTFNILDNTNSAVATARTTDFLVNYRLIAGATTGTEAFKTLGNSLLTVSNAAHIPLQVRGFTSQTANLQEWQNSAGTVLLSVDSGGALVGGSPVSVKLWNRTVQGTGGGSLYIGGSATGAATDGVVIDGNATTFSTGVTSGEWSSLRVGQNNNPNASSTAIHNAILVNPTINYASGGAGSYNALRIKVTETALPSGANYLIYASAGAAGTTEKFSITNAGLGTFAGGVSLADASDLTIGTTTGSKIGQASSKIGFFNATPVAKPTGVAVDAASIHAALVSLGLISA